MLLRVFLILIIIANHFLSLQNLIINCYVYVKTQHNSLGMATHLLRKINTGKISLITFLFHIYFTSNTFHDISEPPKILSDATRIALTRCLGDENNQFNITYSIAVTMDRSYDQLER